MDLGPRDPATARAKPSNMGTPETPPEDDEPADESDGDELEDGEGGGDDGEPTEDMAA